MAETKSTCQCLSCNRPETDMPLVTLQYSGAQTFICTQCLPILIHSPQKLAGKLAGAENIPSAPGHDH